MSSKENRDGIVTVATNSNQLSAADELVSLDREDKVVALTPTGVNYSPKSSLPSPRSLLPTTPVVSEAAPIENQIILDSDEQKDDEVEKYNKMFKASIIACIKAQKIAQSTNNDISNL